MLSDGGDGSGGQPGAKCGREGKVYARQHLELSVTGVEGQETSTQAQSLHNYLLSLSVIFCLILTSDIKHAGTATQLALYIV